MTLAYALLGAGIAAALPLHGCRALSPDTARDARDKACAIVDVAKEACAFISYLTPDGKVATVRVEPEELTEFGLRISAKRAAERAPAPASSGGGK